MAAPGRADGGVSTIEVVILAPLIIFFILLLVAFGQLVDGRGAVDGAARDAARAGSIQRDRSVAEAQAVDTARADLAGKCEGNPDVRAVGDTSFQPDTLFSIQVTCKVRGMDLLGVPITKTVTSTATSPLDPFRRAVAD